jgi:hypothetical protein
MEMLKISSRTNATGYLSLDLPTNIQDSNVEVVIVINPVRESPEEQKYDFSDLAGKLDWQGDALAVQKGLRDEWQ